jgi:aryl-alcohol dehydrogenase-like predicted oxidoreductase
MQAVKEGRKRCHLLPCSVGCRIEIHRAVSVSNFRSKTRDKALPIEAIQLTPLRIKEKACAALAKRRGQKLSQMALAWVLRDPRVTSSIVGVSSVQQLEENLGALDNLTFTREELEEIDRITKTG